MQTVVNRVKCVSGRRWSDAMKIKFVSLQHAAGNAALASSPLKSEIELSLSSCGDFLDFQGFARQQGEKLRRRKPSRIKNLNISLHTCREPLETAEGEGFSTFFCAAHYTFLIIIPPTP